VEKKVRGIKLKVNERKKERKKTKGSHEERSCEDPGGE
jgi:hypothetical protein